MKTTRIVFDPNTPVTATGSPSTIVNVSGPGPKGDAGNASPPQSFAFGDASPTAVFTASAAGLLTRAALLVTQAFNGATPQLSLSKGATPVLSAAQNTPAVAAEYVVSPGLTMAAGETVTLTIIPGFGATQGQGFTLFAFSPF